MNFLSNKKLDEGLSPRTQTPNPLSVTDLRRLKREKGTAGRVRQKEEEPAVRVAGFAEVEAT